MNAPMEFERCQAFLNSQLQTPHREGAGAPNLRRWRAVTISRQTGCGAKAVADRTADYLQSHAGRGAQAWMVFDRNLVAQVLKEHNLPASLAAFMREDRISELEDIMEELFGLHPPTWLLVRQTAETILHLANLGNVILIGRGANIITSKLPFVFHVRLIGSLDRRVERLRQERPQGEKAALKYIRTEDRARRRYLSKHFGRDAGDPSLYHLVINTDLVSSETAGAVMGNAIMESGPAGSESVTTH